MRPRLAGLALAATFTFATAGVWAQAEAERQLDAALERLRLAVAPDATLRVGSRQVDPVTGRARLGDVVIEGGGQTLAVTELWLQDVSADRLGRAEARGLRFEEGTDEVTEAARLAIAGLPLPAQGADFDPATLSVDSFELEAVRNNRPGHGSFTLGRVVIQGYAPGRLRSGVLEAFRLESLTPDTPNMEIARLSMSEIAGPRFDAPDPDPRLFRAGAITLEGLSIEDGQRNVDMTLPRVELRNWEPGRQVEMSLQGLEFAGDMGQLGDGRLQVARLVASGLDAPATLAALMEGVQPPDPPAGVAQLLALEGLSLESNGAPLFSLGRLAFEGALSSTGLATGAIVIDALRASLPRGAAPPLEQMGYRDITASLELRGDAERAGGSLRVAPFRIAIEEAGSITVDARMDNVPQLRPGESLTAGPERMAQYAKARLLGLTLRYQDQGLLGRALTQQARQQRVPEARLREQWAQMALAMPLPEGPQGGRPGAGADPFGPMRQAIASFIRRPGTLEIALRPGRPIGFGEFERLGAQGPAAVVQTLGVSIRAD